MNWLFFWRVKANTVPRYHPMREFEEVNLKKILVFCCTGRTHPSCTWRTL